MTERGSAVLVWLERNPRPGTRGSRAEVAKRAQRRVWRGLHLAGVYHPFMCLHSHEGAWTSETGNGYHGGLQFDDGFQSTYGREYMGLWGSAGHWEVWAQMVAAYRAYHGYHGYGARGFSPWGTRGLCGL
jgi:hypothetical protein